MNQLQGMIEVFKTDISKKKIARTLIRTLCMRFPDYKINIDLDDRDKVLRVESVCAFDAEQIVRFMKEQNVKIEVIT